MTGLKRCFVRSTGVLGCVSRAFTGFLETEPTNSSHRQQQLIARPATDTGHLLRVVKACLALPCLWAQPGTLTFLRFPAPQMVTRGCAFLECFYLLSKGHIFGCGFFEFSFVSLGQIERFGDGGSLWHSHLETENKCQYGQEALMTFPFPTEAEYLCLPLTAKKVTPHINTSVSSLNMHKLYWDTVSSRLKQEAEWKI